VQWCLEAVVLDGEHLGGARPGKFLYQKAYHLGAAPPAGQVHKRFPKAVRASNHWLLVGVLELVDALLEAIEVVSLSNKVVYPLGMCSVNLHIDFSGLGKGRSGLVASISVSLVDAPRKVGWLEYELSGDAPLSKFCGQGLSLSECDFFVSALLRGIVGGHGSRTSGGEGHVFGGLEDQPLLLRLLLLLQGFRQVVVEIVAAGGRRDKGGAAQSIAIDHGRNRRL